MNCEEVMEYMQRYLDGDLSEQEKESMFAHLKSCVSCKEMFERLNRLSDELVSLPKVTPPFSIVDSILPQLDALDRERDAGSAGSRAASSGRRVPGRWKFPGVFGAVAAAACLIVAVTIGTSNGWFSRDQMNTGSSMLFSAESAASGSSATSAGGSSSGASGAASIAASGPGGDYQLKKEAAGNAENYSTTVTGGGTVPARPPEGNASSAGGNPSGIPMTGGASGGGVSGSQGTGSYPGADAIDSIEPALPGQAGGGRFTAVPDRVVDQASTPDSVGPDGAGQPDETGALGGIFTVSGGTEELPATQEQPFASPDGQYSAYFETEESGAIRVVIQNAAGERLFESPAKQTDRADWMEWSEDGGALLYGVTGGEAEGIYEIRLDSWTETKK
jgi:hypothetical protein